MSGRIVAGCQEPAPGSKRDANMLALRLWAETHPGGATYRVIASHLRLSLQAVQRAATDLHLFAPADFVVRIPAPRNQYTFTCGWNDEARRGEGNQARHLATRLATQAVRLERQSGHETDVGRAYAMRVRARASEVEALNQQDFAEVMEP